MLPRAGAGDVEDPPLLLLVRLLGLLLQIRHLRAVDPLRPEAGELEAHAPVGGEPQRAVVLAAVLAEVGHADHRELESLGSVDGHDPDGVELLRLERRLPLALLDQVALGDEVDEPAQVTPLVGLILARHAHQLAHVGHATVPRGQREDAPVVARARDRAVDQRLQRDPRRQLALLREDPDAALEPLAIPTRQGLADVLAAVAGEGLPERPPGVAAAAAGVDPNDHERVERDAAERRGERRVDGELVHRVGQGAEPLAQVEHLLLAPVAAPADQVGRDAALLESPLVEAHVGGRAQEQDDVARLVAGGDQLADPAGEQPRLAGAPERRRAQRLAERRLLAVEAGLPAVRRAVDRQAARPAGPRAAPPPARRAAPGAARTPRRRSARSRGRSRRAPRRGCGS